MQYIKEFMNFVIMIADGKVNTVAQAILNIADFARLTAKDSCSREIYRILKQQSTRRYSKAIDLS